MDPTQHSEVDTVRVNGGDFNARGVVIPEWHMSENRKIGPKVVAAFTVFAASYVAFELIGKGVVVHFLVLVLYGGVFLTLGAVFLGKQQEGSSSLRGEGTSGNLATNGTALAVNARAAEAGAPALEGTAGGPAVSPKGDPAALAEPPLYSSSPSSSQRQQRLSTSLNWVGETVEGSVNWLRGGGYNSGGSYNSGGGGRHRRQHPRERSRSDGGGAGVRGNAPSAGGESNGGDSAATSPGGAGLESGTDYGAGYPILGLGRAAAATAEAAIGHTQRQLGRARGWSRTFGAAGVGGAADGSVGGGVAVLEDDDDGSSLDDNPVDDGTNDGDGSRAGAADWMVGVGMGDESFSESGSLSSATTGGWHGDASGSRRRRVTGGGAGAGSMAAELNWEVDGRRQMLRRSSLNMGGAPTEDNQMVQDLLEMISDAPVDHAGQWRPVRVRRGIHIWTSTVDGSPYCRIRGRMRCEATPAQLLQLLIDDERIAEYDWMFDRYELVERPNDHTSVRWTCYRAIWPTRPRDFVIRSTWEEFADGTIVISTRSVEHEDYPETPTFVRGKMVTCGYVICPLGESRRRGRINKAPVPANGSSTSPGDPNAAGAAAGGVAGTGSGGDGNSSTGEGGGSDGGGSSAAAAAAAAAAVQSPEGRPSSEFTMYAHTDLGGNLPASVINKLCKKPAYRVLRKIQDMIATDTLVKHGEMGEGGPAAAVAAASSAGSGGGGEVGQRPTIGPNRMSRTDSEDVLGSLLAEGMPDRDAAANLEDVPEGEIEGVMSGAETDASGARRRGSVASGTGSADAGGASASVSRRGSATQQRPTTPSPLLPGLSREFAISEAQRIMKTVNRMASDEGLGWSQLGVSAHRDMSLYKSAVAGTKKVRLGASTCVSALPSELVGILLENAAMLGPDYIVDRQELLETFSSGVSTGEGEAEATAAARAAGGETQHDTAIYWFSCTHKRQRICRDFVILRCFRPLSGRGAVIAYSSVDHPGLPPCPDYVRGKLDVSGFVIVPSAQDNGHNDGNAAAAAAAAEAETADAELRSHHSDIEHDRRRSGPRHHHARTTRRHRRGSQRMLGAAGGESASARARRRSRSSASAIGSYLDSEDDEDDESREGGPGRGDWRSVGAGRVSWGAGARGSGISEVTFFTHLKFSAYLPDFQEMEACRHFVGPLHILQELKWVVERTLGSSQEDEVLAEAAAKLQVGAMGGGADWGNAPSSSHPRRKSGTDGSRRGSGGGGGGGGGEGGGEGDGGAADGETSAPDDLGIGSASMSDTESSPAGDGVVSNAVLLRVSAKREAVLRDMLAFSSDGEGMDGPQVDWRLIKQGDGVRLWRAQVPGTVWCMIRTRTALVAPPQVVLDYLLDDTCIPTYDELFDKIEVIEAVDSTSTFKRTCYKPIWPTAPRDFSLLSSWGALEDGTAYLLNRSIDHPMNPPVKGFVRGVVMLCGFLMVPRPPEGGGGCTMTMIVHTDLGGSLPASILNHLSTNSPWRLVQRLRTIFEENAPTPAAAPVASMVTAPAPVGRADEQGPPGEGQSGSSQGPRRVGYALSEGEGRTADGLPGQGQAQEAAAALVVSAPVGGGAGARGDSGEGDGLVQQQARL